MRKNRVNRKLTMLSCNKTFHYSLGCLLVLLRVSEEEVRQARGVMGVERYL
jgi:hypothetical protein